MAQFGTCFSQCGPMTDRDPPEHDTRVADRSEPFRPPFHERQVRGFVHEVLQALDILPNRQRVEYAAPPQPFSQIDVFLRFAPDESRMGFRQPVDIGGGFVELSYARVTTGPFRHNDIELGKVLHKDDLRPWHKVALLL
jgi:hypothetical protein